MMCFGRERKMRPEMRPEPLKVVSREGKLWPALASGLHGPRRAFVWWQGESDSTPDLLASYELKLVNLIARVRQENGDPTLLVVLVKVILNRNQPIRDAENTHRGARSERGAGRCR